MEVFIYKTLQRHSRDRDSFYRRDITEVSAKQVFKK